LQSNGKYERTEIPDAVERGAECQG